MFSRSRELLKRHSEKEPKEENYYDLSPNSLEQDENYRRNLEEESVEKEEELVYEEI